MSDEKGSGFVMVPNEFFERWLPRLSGAETKVALCVIRKTLGFDKDRDAISASQISVATGLKRRTVFDGLRGLREKGFLRRFSETGNATNYQVVGIRPVQHTAHPPVQENAQVNGRPVQPDAQVPVRPTTQVPPEPVQENAHLPVQPGALTTNKEKNKVKMAWE